MGIRDIKNYAWSTSFQVTVVILITSINLLWFLPTVSSLRQSISEQEKLKVEKSLADIEAFFEDKEVDIEAPSRYITSPLKSPENEKIVRKILKEDYFINVSLSDTNGNEILKYSKNDFISSTDFKNLSSKGDFKKVLGTGKPSWSSVRISSTFEPFITLNVPVFGVAEEIIGVISAEFSVQSLFKELSTESYGGGIYVVDKNGLLISHHDSSLVLKNTNFYDRLIVKDVINKRGVIVANNDTYTYVNEAGVKVLSAGGYFDDVGLAVIYEEPKNDAFASLRRIEIFFVVAFIFISLMVLTLRRANAKADKARRDVEGLFAEQKKLLGVVEKSKKELESVNENLLKREKEIKVKVLELEKFQKLTIDRELKMIELKKEVEELKKQLTINN